jgi:hypothetical protein
MAAFVINIGGELLKTRKTMAFWLTIAGSAFIPLVEVIPYLARPDVFVPRFKNGAWSQHIKEAVQPAAAFLIPMYVILVTSLIVQIEYRNNTWKQVYASPRSYADIYFSKFCVIHTAILSCLILFNLFLVLSGYIANIFQPDYTFFSTPVPWNTMLWFTIKLYVSVLGISAIQYWISLRIRNFIAPLAIGVGLLIVGFMIVQWDKSIYYPYIYTAISFFVKKNFTGIDNHEIYSMVWMAGIIALSFWDTVTRREKG